MEFDAAVMLPEGRISRVTQEEATSSNDFLNQRNFRAGQYIGEISALCFLRLPSHISSLPFLLAGTGSQVLLYNLESDNLIKSFNIFGGIRVHGISSSFNSLVEGCNSSIFCFNIAIFGERKVKLFRLNIEMVMESTNQLKINMILFCSLPRLGNWVLDVSFLKGTSFLLVVGCGDNSLWFWDYHNSIFILEAKCPERCFIYSMRFYGETFEDFCIASGTTHNEIIVWKIFQKCIGTLNSEDYLNRSMDMSVQFQSLKFESIITHRLVGHEGSIFRIAWSYDGCRLVSVSDDRSYRIWVLWPENKKMDNDIVRDNYLSPISTALFGHDARIWDCCISDDLLVTAGEDCTCRLWGWDGKEIKVINDHVGRGIWRCLLDPLTSIIVTAGFDSAIKVYQLCNNLISMNLEQCYEGSNKFVDKTKLFTVTLSDVSGNHGLSDSKSEYVRCVHVSHRSVIYVATNCGFVYMVQPSNEDVMQWSISLQVSKDAPIICMDLLHGQLLENSGHIEDWIAIGDGKGRMTILKISRDISSPKMAIMVNWCAEEERRLLGTFWCKSLGSRYVFTSDPRGILKLWRLSYSSNHNYVKNSVSLITKFISSFGNRIMCLDASVDEEFLVCGDLRGNLLLFPLPKSSLVVADTQVASEKGVVPLTYFRGYHGISKASSISITKIRDNLFEILSTGGDGCICYMEYDRFLQSLDFTRMRRVKGISLIESVAYVSKSNHDKENLYALGFSSTEFVIWDLVSDALVVRVSCGGWRRPHSYFINSVSGMENYFCYVKDEVIHIQRLDISVSMGTMFRQSLHSQFHGREIHCVCFIHKGIEHSQIGAAFGIFSSPYWVATGSEDGTVRLTCCSNDSENLYLSNLLGEHIGGSAVRSVCFISTTIIFVDDENYSNAITTSTTSDEENMSLLISVGAKRVLTCWLLNVDNFEEETSGCSKSETLDGFTNSPRAPFLQFRWLSTDIPSRGRMKSNGFSQVENDENDWRYLSVTSFLIKSPYSRISVCFVVVSCADATVSLRAFTLPHKLWFDVAMLSYDSPILSLSHVIISLDLPCNDYCSSRSSFIVIGGSTDGSVLFWDLSEKVKTFMKKISSLDMKKFCNFRQRPRTGRGSQGGRMWRSLDHHISKKEAHTKHVPTKGKLVQQHGVENNPAVSDSEPSFKPDFVHTFSPNPVPGITQKKKNDVSPSIFQIQPFRVLKNLHQSGVNCLHISNCRSGTGFDFGSYVVVSGGDDQSVQCLGFNFGYESTSSCHTKNEDAESVMEKDNILRGSDCFECRESRCRLTLLHRFSISSAHSSAVKGIWTDGLWVFSTGLDQRVRCWKVDGMKLVERDHVIVSVPEPEALDVVPCGRDVYQISVVGRGLQLLYFSPPPPTC